MTLPETLDIKFEIDIEGELKPWSEDHITTEEIAALGSWDPSLGVIRIDELDGSERVLDPEEVVKLSPGIQFAKNVKFKRG